MSLSRSAVAKLIQSHSHSSEALKIFAPLFYAQKKCLEKTQSLEVPEFEPSQFLAGKPWLASVDIPYTDNFLKTSTTLLVNTAIKVLPDHKDDLVNLKLLIRKDIQAARELVRYRLAGKIDQVKKWAKKYKQEQAVSELIAMLLGGTVAQSFQQMVEKDKLAKWDKGYCPICGSLPQGSLLKETEGKRYLHCSLCAHEWRYMRTACPLCEKADTKDVSLFFFEEKPEERAEACDICKQYLLALDTRKLADEKPPLDLYFLCMAPLDFMLQEKGYVPAPVAKIV